MYLTQSIDQFAIAFRLDFGCSCTTPFFLLLFFFTTKRRFRVITCVFFTQILSFFSLIYVNQTFFLLKFKSKKKNKLPNQPYCCFHNTNVVRDYTDFLQASLIYSHLRRSNASGGPKDFWLSLVTYMN